MVILFGLETQKNALTTVSKLFELVCIVQISFGLNFYLLGLMFYMFLRQLCDHLCKKILCILQMSVLSRRQMQALDMNSVCLGVVCFMHVYVVHIFDAVEILRRFVKFLAQIIMTVTSP